MSDEIMLLLVTIFIISIRYVYGFFKAMYEDITKDNPTKEKVRKHSKRVKSNE